MKFYHEQLSSAGFGWMGWVVREGLDISTRRDRYDGNGINGQGFHPLTTLLQKDLLPAGYGTQSWPSS